jgi:hypothetical protein
MKSWMHILRSGILLTFAVMILAFLNLLIHEFGHCITMNKVEGICEGVYILPGIKVWPLSDFGESYQGDWSDRIGVASYAEVPQGKFERGLVSFMGSGSIAFVSTIALIALWVFKPKGWGQNLLLIQAIFFGDILLYTILPEWFDLQHFFFIGGAYPEPLEGAMAMGISKNIFIAGVLIYSVFMMAGWLMYINKFLMAKKVDIQKQKR